ncbi:hypothetical protein AAEX28_08630 [Lentisphaerota bacterium WC36G]|nr:hypothetical protein LJT99_11485 [Lentisphaerae bacterium WC36]
MAEFKAQKIVFNDYPVVGEQFSSLATVPFSWSIQRKNIYEYCQRKYFLHYYASSNGYDKNNCSELERELYLLKNLKPLHYMIKEVFLEVLKNELQTFCGKMNVKKIVKNIYKTAKKELLKRLQQANDYQKVVNEPKHYAIHECFYCVYSVGEIKKIALNELDLLVKNFCSENNQFFEDLIMAKNGDVKFHDNIDSFMLSKTLIWVAPDLIYESKGVLHCLNLKFGKYSVMNAFTFQNSLILLYLMNNFPTFKDKILLQNFYYQNNDLKSYSTIDFDGNKLAIQLDASIETLRQIANKNILSVNDFAKFDLDKDLSCNNCNFKSFCSKH